MLPFFVYIFEVKYSSIFRGSQIFVNFSCCQWVRRTT